MCARADRRMNRQNRKRAETVSHRSKDQRSAHRAGGSSRTVRPAREPRAKPELFGKRRARLRPVQDMRARFACVGRGADRLGVEEWRVGDDATGRFASPASRRALGSRTSSRKTRRRPKPVALRIALGERRLPQDQSQEDRRTRAMSAERAQARPRRPPRRRRNPAFPSRPPPQRAGLCWSRPDGRASAASA